MPSFRLDRFLTLYFFYPLFKRTIASSKKIPILMYHGVSDYKHDHAHPYYETVTSPAVFYEQMCFLKSQDYKIINLKEVVKVYRENAQTCHKYAAITFDDGLQDCFADAFPILEKLKFPATVFLPTGLMGNTVAGSRVMSWDNARALLGKDIFFGSHSVNHLKLVDLEPFKLEYELKHSRMQIESELGINTDTFSYPFAFPEQNRIFTQILEKLLAKNQYRIGVTTIIGRSSEYDPNCFLKRIPVNTYDDLRLFEAKLSGGYDWLHKVQLLSKIVRS